jgi:hypothetical protein
MFLKLLTQWHLQLYFDAQQLNLHLEYVIHKPHFQKCLYDGVEFSFQQHAERERVVP